MAPTENVINHVGPGEIHDSVQGGSKRTIDAALQLSVLHDIRREAELASARLASEISTFNRRISSLLSNMEVAITGGANGTSSAQHEKIETDTALHRLTCSSVVSRFEVCRDT
mmetsp:Transcript_2647/g.4756  ORF Transcript_2647/g.4756 Transcript_2647/m.4756 type:complete len:113 (+) Transcript_2647:737-1075(+)